MKLLDRLIYKEGLSVRENLLKIVLAMVTYDVEKSKYRLMCFIRGGNMEEGLDLVTYHDTAEQVKDELVKTEQQYPTEQDYTVSIDDSLFPEGEYYE